MIIGYGVEALDVVGFLGASSEVNWLKRDIRDAREVDLEYLRSTKKLDRYEQIQGKGTAYYQTDSWAIAIGEIMCKRIRDNKRIYL